jgi:hypothetical protein
VPPVTTKLISCDGGGPSGTPFPGTGPAGPTKCYGWSLGPFILGGSLADGGAGSPVLCEVATREGCVTFGGPLLSTKV